jgi:hypothetical protein
MLLKPKTTEANQKAANFVTGGVKTVTPPRARVQKYDEGELELYIKLLFFGGPGTGKTYITKDLLELGFKVLVITTDLGGDGLKSVIIPMRREGTWDLLKSNLRSVEIEGYDDVEAFISAPETSIPDIYEWDPDFVIWDGISGWQVIDVGEKIGDYAVSDKASDAERDGLQMNIQKWGQIQRATLRGLANFTAMKNKKTGRQWDKIGTCLEAIKSKGGGQGGFVETREPLVQGGAGKHITGVFDMIVRTSITSSPLDEDGSKREYHYILQGHQNLAAKVRGFAFPPKMKADGKELIVSIFEQLGRPLPKLPIPGI